MRTASSLIWNILEGGLWIVGALLISIFVGNRFTQSTQASENIQKFELATAKKVTEHEMPTDYMQAVGVDGLEKIDEFNQASVNTDLWSIKRKSTYTKLINADNDFPQALLYVDELDMTVPIYLGASDSNLEKGAGWIKNTAGLEDSGNIGLAAHRDSFFRALKDIRVGQIVRLKTLSGEREFEVANIDIVDPSRVDVLKSSGQNELTLVTCYPFYHVGKAPKRFIVSAIEVP